MSYEIAVLDERASLQQHRDELAVSLGLPALGSQIISEYGMEWKVLGHTYARDLTSYARDGGDISGENPRDLMPVITLKNPSPRLKDFWIAADRCTSRPMSIVDTVPHMRPQQAHPNGYWVDHLSWPDSIWFFLDAATIHETIMAHEIAHVWVDIVEGCEDYRVLRDLSDPSRYRQVQHVQSFVLDRKVHEVLRKRGFDLTIIEEHQREALLSLSRAVIAGYEPPYAREEATIAMLIAATLLEQEQGLHNVPVLSLVLAYDGTLGSALRLLKQELPEIYELAEYLTDSVRRHGYSNREGIYRAIDDCLLATFDFTGDPLRLDEDLEEKPCGDSYELDKWPDFFPGWSVQAKVEAGKAMAKYDIGSEVTWDISYTPGGTLLMSFKKDSGEWTPPTMLPHAPSRLPELEMMRMGPNPRQRLTPSSWTSHPQLNHPVAPQPRVPKPYMPTRYKPPMPRMPMPHVPQAPMPRTPFPNVEPRVHAQRSTPSHIPPLPSPFNKPRSYGRDYMPGLGLWLSRARLKEQMEFREHPYTYALNNPINYNDPSGLLPPITLGGKAVQAALILRRLKVLHGALTNEKRSKCDPVRLRRIHDYLSTFAAAGRLRGFNQASRNVEVWLSGRGAKNPPTISYQTLQKDAQFEKKHNAFMRRLKAQACRQTSFTATSQASAFTAGTDLHNAFHMYALSASVKAQRTGRPCGKNSSCEEVKVTITYQFKDEYDWERGETTNFPFGLSFPQSWAVDLLECTANRPNLVGRGKVPSAPRDYFTYAWTKGSYIVCCSKRK